MNDPLRSFPTPWIGHQRDDVRLSASRPLPPSPPSPPSGPSTRPSLACRQTACGRTKTPSGTGRNDSLRFFFFNLASLLLLPYFLPLLTDEGNDHDMKNEHGCQLSQLAAVGTELVLAADTAAARNSSALPLPSHPHHYHSRANATEEAIS